MLFEVEYGALSVAIFDCILTLKLSSRSKTFCPNRHAISQEKKHKHIHTHAALAYVHRENSVGCDVMCIMWELCKFHWRITMALANWSDEDLRVGEKFNKFLETSLWIERHTHTNATSSDNWRIRWVKMTKTTTSFRTHAFFLVVFGWIIFLYLLSVVKAMAEAKTTDIRRKRRKIAGNCSLMRQLGEKKEVNRYASNT